MILSPSILFKSMCVQWASTDLSQLEPRRKRQTSVVQTLFGIKN